MEWFRYEFDMLPFAFGIDFRSYFQPKELVPCLKHLQKKMIEGQTAFIDERYRTKSLISKNLVDIMEKCWIYNPKDRIDIFEVVRLLRETRDEHERRKGAGAISNGST